MRWSYKTIHFELKKDGLLGGAFLDESEMEEELNKYGSSGWELVSLVETRDGALAVFKQPLDGSVSPLNVDGEAEPEAQEAAVVSRAAAAAVDLDGAEHGSGVFEDDEIYGYEESADEEPLEEPLCDDENDEDETPDRDEAGIGSIRIE